MISEEHKGENGCRVNVANGSEGVKDESRFN